MQVDAHEISLLADGEQVFPAMLADIAGARREVLLEMYWIGDDRVGVAFRRALASAVRRGCAVRVIFDGFGSWELPGGFWDELIAAGGRLRTFHPLSELSDAPFFRSLVRRDHRKILLVDRQVAYVGGLNLASPWQLRAQGGEGWRDVALRLAGTPAAIALAQVFDETWQYVSEPTAEALFTTPLVRLGPRLMLLINTPQRYSGRIIRRMYLWAIRRARRSIDIAAAYFMPRPLFVQALLQAHRRGVRIRIILPCQSDVLLANLIAAPIVRLLVRSGILVYAYQAGILHAKTAVVDEKWVTVGSHNLDTLSWAWNLECNVAVEDEALGKEMSAAFESDLKNSLPYGSKQEAAGFLDRLQKAAGNLLLAGYRRL